MSSWASSLRGGTKNIPWLALTAFPDPSIPTPWYANTGWESPCVLTYMLAPIPVAEYLSPSIITKSPAFNVS